MTFNIEHEEDKVTGDWRFIVTASGSQSEPVITAFDSMISLLQSTKKQFLQAARREVRIYKQESTMDKILRLVVDKGPRTKRELQQSINGTNAESINSLVNGMVADGSLISLISGKTKRFSIPS